LRSTLLVVSKLHAVPLHPSVKDGYCSSGSGGTCGALAPVTIKRRAWRKLHIGLDAAASEIAGVMAQTP
jgi:hypothetical protein